MYAFGASLTTLKAYVRSVNFLNTIGIALHPIIMSQFMETEHFSFFFRKTSLKIANVVGVY